MKVGSGAVNDSGQRAGMRAGSCLSHSLGREDISALWGTLTSPALALDGLGALRASGHCLRASKPLLGLICAHSWGQNAGFNQQLLRPGYNSCWNWV